MQESAEVTRLRDRLRKTAQILIEEVGADCPMDAEDAARKAVEQMSILRTLADESAHEAGLYARRMEQAQRSRLEARSEERAAVVEWLRANVAQRVLSLDDTIACIERGEHIAAAGGN